MPCCTAATSASLAVVELFAAWPTHFVFGNCDTDTQKLAAAIGKAGQTCHGLFGDLTLEGVRIALLHSHDGRKFRETIQSGEYGLVCYGHTHVAAIDRRGENGGPESRRDLSRESAQRSDRRSAGGDSDDRGAVEWSREPE